MQNTKTAIYPAAPVTIFQKFLPFSKANVNQRERQQILNNGRACLVLI